MSIKKLTPYDLKIAGSREIGSFSNDVEETDWSGSGYDILMSYLYLRSKKYPNVILEFPHTRLDNRNQDMMWNLVIQYRYSKSAPHKSKIIFPGGKKEYFNFIRKCVDTHTDSLHKKTKVRNHQKINKNVSKNTQKLSLKFKKGYQHLFIVTGIFIGRNKSGHYNLIIFDVKRNMIIRIEPYGKSYSSPEIEKYLDQKLQKIFQTYGFPVKVLSPSQFMAERSFQWIEENKELKEGIGEDKPSDPGGMCGVWATFLAHQIFKYPKYSLPRLIRKLQKKIIGEVALRDFIRNLSHHYLKRGRKLLISKKEDSQQYHTTIQISESILGIQKSLESVN